MRQLILVINTGSSSLKFSIFEKSGDDDLSCLRDGKIEGFDDKPLLRINTESQSTPTQVYEVKAKDPADAVSFVAEWTEREFPGILLLAVGHRVVHGGTSFSGPRVIDDQSLTELRETIKLDPLHQPICIAAIENCRRVFPSVPQIACFDTAFHITQPDVATTIALPRSITNKGVRRFGFHGLSYQYVSTALASINPTHAAGRVVIAHLGNGASLCALQNCRSQATTMGFSVLDGLVMGTRCGSIDPGVLLYLLNTLHLTPQELEDILYRKSGLLGVSELSSDVRVLLASADPKAKAALDLYVYRIVREIGSLSAALQGLDALVFTGGVGENATVIRRRVLTDLAWLGFVVDEESNLKQASVISARDSKIPAYVIPTNENRMIALETCRDRAKL